MEFTRAFSAMLVTEVTEVTEDVDDDDDETREFFYRETLKMPRAAHAKLLRWALFGDWWDSISRIDVPTLAIGGRASKNPWQNMERITSMIPDCELLVFEEDERGSHGMRWENPVRYNSALRDFLAGPRDAPRRSTGPAGGTSTMVPTAC